MIGAASTFARRWPVVLAWLVIAGVVAHGALTAAPTANAAVVRAGAKPEQSAVVAGAIVLSVACFAIVAGALGSLVWFVHLKRRLTLRFVPAEGPAARSAVLAAAALLTYVLAAKGVRAVVPGVSDVGFLPGTLVIGLACAAVAVSWRRASDRDAAAGEVGWTRGAGGLRETGAAIVAVPLHVAVLSVAVVLSVVVARLLGRDVASAAHPAGAVAASSRGLALAGLFFHACVAAPVFEETVFRGFLFHHLRSSTAAWGRPTSFAVSAVVQAIVFASLHPQGVIGIPVLAGIACVLAALREWRGSLVAPIVLHGLSNGAVFLLAVATR